MDITFNCDFCGQSITVDESGHGSVVNCPKCSESLVVPEQKRPTQAAATNLRRCPDCGREVSKRAAACPQCGAPVSTPKPFAPVTIDKATVIVGDVRISWGNAVDLTWKITACAAIISLVGALITWFLMWIFRQ